MLNQFFESLSGLVSFWPAVAVFIILGIAGLKYGADSLVSGASNLGFRIGFSATMVGLTIVAFGTSAPELVVSILTSIEDKPEICLGNVVGSNIANTTLILGVSAFIFPLRINRSAIREDAPLGLAAIVLVMILSFAGNGLSRLDGFFLLIVFAVWMVWIIGKSLREAAAERERRTMENGDQEPPRFQTRPVNWDFLLILLGLIALVIGAQSLVTGAVYSARALNVPEVVLGLTVVAGGTSLPELAVSIMAALRRHDDISIGNVMGSNIFNALLILGAAVMISPISFAATPGNAGARASLIYDIPFCVATGVLILILIQNRRLGRIKGFFLTALYFGYFFWLFLRHT